MKSFIHYLIPSLITCGLACTHGASLTASEHDLRIVPQLIVGTAGVEPGVALEFRSADLNQMVLRPEVFLNEDHRVGGGGAVLLEIGDMVDLPQAHALSVGPRFVAHNSDDTGWELDAMATYAVSLGSMTQPWRHAVGVLAALGVRKDKVHDEARLGANAGVFYSFRF